MTEPVFLVGGARTAFGGFNRTLATLSVPTLGGVAFGGALTASGVGPDEVDDVIMGLVLPAGAGQAPARQAAANAAIPWSARAVTINKMCGSGMQAIIRAHDVQ